jgi:hypothetical protein
MRVKLVMETPEQHEAEVTSTKLFAEHAISEAVFYIRELKCDDLDAFEAQRRRAMADDNRTGGISKPEPRGAEGGIPYTAWRFRVVLGNSIIRRKVVAKLQILGGLVESAALALSVVFSKPL